MEQKKKIDKPYRTPEPLYQPEVIPTIDPDDPSLPEEDPDENPYIAPPEEMPPLIISYPIY